MYGPHITGNNDSVALACVTDTRCKAFRYSAKLGFGYLCAELDARVYSDTVGGYSVYGDWELCTINPG